MASQDSPAGGFILGSNNIQPGTTYSFLATLSYTGESPFTLVSAASTISTPATNRPVPAAVGSSVTSQLIASSATPQERPTSRGSRPLQTSTTDTSNVFSQSRPINSISTSSRPTLAATSSPISGSSLSAQSSDLSSSVSSSLKNPPSISSTSKPSSQFSQTITASPSSTSSDASPPLAAGASSSSSGGTSKGVIIGAVVGSVLGFLLLLLLLFLLLFLLRRRRRNRSVSKERIFHPKPDDTFFTSAATSVPGTAGGGVTAKGALSEKSHKNPFGESPYTPHSERSAVSDHAPAIPAVSNLGSSAIADRDFGQPRGTDLEIGAVGLAGVGAAVNSNSSHQDYPGSRANYEQASTVGARRSAEEHQPSFAASATSSEKNRQKASGGIFGHRRSRNSVSTEASSVRGSARGIWPFSSNRGDTRPSTATKSIVDEDPPVLPDVELAGRIDPLFGSVAARKKATSPEPSGRDASTAVGMSEDPSINEARIAHPPLHLGAIPVPNVALESEKAQPKQAAANAPSPQEERVVLSDPSDPSYFSMQAPPEPKPRSPLRAQKQVSSGITSQSNSATNSRPITPAAQVQNEALAAKPGTTPPLQTFLHGSSSKKNTREPDVTSEQQSPVSPTRSYQGHTRDQSNATSGSLDDSTEAVEVGTAVPMPIPSRNTRRISRPYIRPTTDETNAFNFQFDEIRAGPYAIRSEPNTAFQTARHSQEHLPQSRDDYDGQRYYDRQSNMARGSLRNSRAKKQRGSWFVEEDDDDAAPRRL